MSYTSELEAQLSEKNQQLELRQTVIEQQSGKIAQLEAAVEKLVGEGQHAQQEWARWEGAARTHSSTIAGLQAEIRKLEGELELPGNCLLANLHGTWVELELAIEYRAADIDCEGDGDGEGTDTDPLECQHCRKRAEAEVAAFMAISAMVKGTLLAARNILHIDDPKYLPVSPVKADLDENIRWGWREDAWDSCMAMVPVGTFGPYEPETYDGYPEAFSGDRPSTAKQMTDKLVEELGEPGESD